MREESEEDKEAQTKERKRERWWQRDRKRMIE